MTGFYERLGVPGAINGVGPATRLGGLDLHPEVWEAMREALATPVRMDELERAAGARIAGLLGVPAAYVTSGASAALFMATAAVMSRDDSGLIDRLPVTDGMRCEVIVQAAQRDPYDRAAEAAGARIVTIGYPESTHPGELERALGDRTAAVLYRPGRNGNLLALADTARIAHSHDVPVIVDGALFAPPAARLREFLDAGADLVAVSGGKGFRGPQASGLLVGRADLVGLVAVQHQDMDERVSTWPPNHDAAEPATPPRHGIARSMKVGREQIAGLLAAIERHVREPGADEGPGIAELDVVQRLLVSSGSLGVVRHDQTPLAVPELDLDIASAGADVDTVVLALARRSRPVYLGESEAWRGVLTVNPMALRSGDGEQLALAVLDAVGAAG